MKRFLVVTALMALALPVAAGAPGNETGKPAPKPATVKGDSKLLTNASDPQLNEQAPATYKVRFNTSRGAFVVEVHRDWAPNGADRFYNLVKNGFYDEARFFRVVPGFMVQFGIPADAKIAKVWREARIKDDPVKQSNKKGYVTFATAGPNTRTSQVFINYADKNSFLDNQGFAPFGKVVEGMDVVEKINAKHTEKPDQGRIQSEGNVYLMKEFPDLDHVKSTAVEK